MRSEAELMLALEALKETLEWIRYDIESMKDYCAECEVRALPMSRMLEHEAKLAHQRSIMQSLRNRTNDLFDACHYTEHDILDEKGALVLYCQQFAFAPQMVAPCARILTCAQKQLRYDYGFPANYVPEHHLHNEPQPQ